MTTDTDPSHVAWEVIRPLLEREAIRASRSAQTAEEAGHLVRAAFALLDALDRDLSPRPATPPVARTPALRTH